MQCICFWHARDLQIPTWTETNTRRILQIHKNTCNQSHRMRVTNWWLLHQCIFYCTTLSRVQHWGCHTIVNIESFRSEHIYWRDFAELIWWCNGSIMNTEFQPLCSRAHLLVRFIRLVQSEFWFLRYFIDAWKYTSTRRLHLPKCVFTSLVMVRGDVQAVSGRRTCR